MRFVPLQSVRENSILMKSIYGTNGQLLLNAGVKLNSEYIKKLKSIGLNGVYIRDDISDNIEAVSVINDSLKIEAVKNIKNMFVFAGKPHTSVLEQNRTFFNLSNIVDSVVEDITKNQNLLVNIIDLKVFDDYTFYHSVNVTVLSIVLGVALNLSKSDLQQLGVAAILHDIGKIFVPKEVLNKQGKLNDNEWKLIKKHTTNGYNYLKNRFNLPSKSYKGILQHHERWDGNGYPHGVDEKNISLFGRIISITDVYDALISDRPYRKGFSPFEAIEYIMGGSGSLFDLDLVKIFVDKIAPYPVGTIVILSNNCTGIVTENYAGRGTRPVIRVFKENDKKVEPYIVDLWNPNTKAITITGQIIDYQPEE